MVLETRKAKKFFPVKAFAFSAIDKDKYRTFPSLVNCPQFSKCLLTGYTVFFFQEQNAVFTVKAKAVFR